MCHLKWRKIASLQKLHKPRDDALANDLLDGRVPLCDSRSCCQLSCLCRSNADDHSPSQSMLEFCV